MCVVLLSLECSWSVGCAAASAVGGGGRGQGRMELCNILLA